MVLHYTVDIGFELCVYQLLSTKSTPIRLAGVWSGLGLGVPGLDLNQA